MSFRTPIAAPFNPDTLGACTAGPPVVSIDDVSVDEDAGIATFTVSLSSPAVDDVVVDIESADDTATAGFDYSFPSPSIVTILTGDMSAEVDVDILDDLDTEGTETFTMTLTGVTGTAVLGDTVGIGLIIDDEVNAWRRADH